MCPGLQTLICTQQSVKYYPIVKELTGTMQVIWSTPHMCIALTTTFIVCRENNWKMEVQVLVIPYQIQRGVSSASMHLCFTEVMVAILSKSYPMLTPRPIFDRVSRTVKGPRPCPPLWPIYSVTCINLPISQFLSKVRVRVAVPLNSWAQIS